MPFKKNKKDSQEALELEWSLQVKNYKLCLDRKRCVGCEICTLACPKQAISTAKQTKVDGKAQKAKIDIDIEKCNFCGVCEITCPYGAVKVSQNGSSDLAVLKKESYPKLIRDITVNPKKCDKTCNDCKTICPLDLIKISKVGFDNKPIEDFSKLSELGKKRVQVTVNIDKQHCPTCRVCEFKCSPGAIRVTKTFEGKIAIDQEKCHEGCNDCFDVCPITGALVLGANGKVYTNELFCTYCGACLNVCPKPEALTLKRTKIHHEPVHSGAWNKTLERLTSSENAVKELKANASKARLQLVEDRFRVEELKKK